MSETKLMLSGDAVTQPVKILWDTVVAYPSFWRVHVVQSDHGSNFMSKVFQQVLQQLGVTHCPSCAYHPESQGAGDISSDFEVYVESSRLWVRERLGWKGPSSAICSTGRCSRIWGHRCKLTFQSLTPIKLFKKYLDYLIATPERRGKKTTVSCQHVETILLLLWSGGEVSGNR
jgi:hypothetical protein